MDVEDAVDVEEKVKAPTPEIPVEYSKTLKIPVNTASTICYGSGFLPLFGWGLGLLMLFLERDTRVRFHAYQAVVVFGVSDVVRMLLNQTVLFERLSSLVYLLQFVLWLTLMYQTYEGNRWVLPYVGPWAKRQLGKNVD